jgi:hypothetical protein
MKPKTNLLIRDLAQLALKYSADDWSPILRELADDSPTRILIRAAIEEVVKEAQLASKRSKARHRTQRPQKKAVRTPRSKFGDSVAEIIENRRVVPTLGHLRQIAFAVGMKAALPSSRDRAANDLINYLETFPAHKQAMVLDLLGRLEPGKRQDAREDYQRWFSVILSNPGRSNS